MTSPISRDTWDNVVIVVRDGNLDTTWDGKTKMLTYNVNTLAWEAQAPITAGIGGGGGNAAAGLTGVAVPTSAGYTGFSSAGNLVGVSGVNPLPVTVGNFPATQPVSVASMPSTPVTGTFFQATQPVSIASMPSTPVTGTFWQATQPVSAASLPLPTGASTAAKQPALGTAGTASVDVLTVQGAASMTALKVDGSAVTQPVSGTVTANAGTGSFTVAQATPANLNATVTPIAITKATQGATGFTVQDLKDAGRSARTFTLDGFAIAATSETLNTMSYSTDNGTLTTGTSYAVTTAKRLRIQQITAALHTISGNTTAVAVIVRIRVNNGGAAIVSSPVQAVLAIPGVAAANGASTPVTLPIPDGWEFVAGAGIGVTTSCAGFVTTTAAPKVDITITGYEY